MKTKILFMISAILFCCNSIYAESNKNKAEKYDITVAGSGVQGTYLVKVWVYSKKGKVSDEQLKYAAVHGCIFRGFSGSQGLPSARPMASNPTVEQEKADYFSTFFDGTYLQFASVVEGSYEVVKMKKKGYKVGAVVQVSKDNLRRELENAGIIKGLASGF